MSENGQNGCKVFASIAKFGETKFKPIRKQENNNNNIKQNTIEHQVKRTKIEENQQPKSRVNKFFKSRNSSSDQEENKIKKPVTTNITQIKNEPKFKELIERQSTKFAEFVEKPLKIKIKKEKEKKEQIKKVIVEQKPAKQLKQDKLQSPPLKSPILKSPTLKSPPAVSNQTRYSTRSRRNEPPTSDDNTESSNQLVNNSQINQLIESPKNQLGNLQIKESKNVQRIEPEKPIHQYRTRRSRKVVNKNLNDEDNEMVETINEQQNLINELPLANIDLEENLNEDQLKLNCNQNEIDQDNFYPDLNHKHEQQFVSISQQKAEEESEFMKPFGLTQPLNLANYSSSQTTEEESDSMKEFSLTAPLYMASYSSSQKTEEESDSIKPFTLSQTTDTTDQQTTNQNKPVILPQKKRFFSKTDKEKKVQYNVKNFFSTNNQANEFEDQLKDLEGASKPQNNSKEYDSDMLKKVKEAHKCAELGEAEHFDGDISLYLSGIKETSNSNNSIRCLSILGLTGQCLSKPELRMHLRAHDYMNKVIRALMDSPKDPNLALCAACLMFVYNQDRLTMDIDPKALSLMLELLETKADLGQIEQKHKEKIIDYCKIMKTKGHGKYLKLNEISAGTLAMETLLGLTSKRAGDWFKEELRSLKGIDFLIDTILNTSSAENNEFMQIEGELNKIDRSLRVIENVTCQNKDNQIYVIEYKENSFVKRCMRLYELCRNNIICCESTTNHFLSPLLTILRVFSNLTSDSQDGCAKIGNSLPDIFDIFLDSVFELPSFVVPDSRFDLIIFLLCLCLNLIESCDQLHNDFINNESQIKRLIVMLEERCNEAKKTEQQADDFLDSEETQRQLNAETINIDSILTDLVAKSGKHMEHTIIAACISLLIGSGLKDNYKRVDSVRKLLPNQSFTMMIDVITKLKEFSNLASIMTRSGITRVESILSVLKHF